MLKQISLAVLIATCLMAKVDAAPVYRVQLIKPGVNVTESTGSTPVPTPTPTPPAPTCSAGTLVFSEPGTFNWPLPPGCTELTFRAWGAGGANSAEQALGGAGAFASGQLTLTPGTVLSLRVGAPGVYDYSKAISGGGGLSGIWLGNDALLIAGAGGGAGKWSRGGAGGQAGEGIFVGQAGTNSSGGGGCNGAAGSALTGGTVKTYRSGYSSGNGGSGYYGGGGGCAIWWNSDYYGSAGGGGSSYVSSVLTNASILPGYYQTPGGNTDANRGRAGEPQTVGRIAISFK